MTKLELVGEHWKDNLLGLTMTRELGSTVQEKYSRELVLIRAEMRLKDLKEGKPRTRQNLNDVVTVSILDRKNRILDIGFNDPKDLMLNSSSEKQLQNTNQFSKCSRIRVHLFFIRKLRHRYD